jgi:hypothetical protein
MGDRMSEQSTHSAVKADQQERMPKYIIKKPKFFCPLSPMLLWHHGLEYKSCPVGPEHRDMVLCEKCKCKGDSKVKTKTSKRHDRGRKKDIPKIEKRSKEPIPKIGKTYTSK